MSKFFIYIIRSKEGYYFTGHTLDLQRRLNKHNSSLSQSTKHGHNWQIIYTEEFSTRAEAMKREKWL